MQLIVWLGLLIGIVVSVGWGNLITGQREPQLGSEITHSSPISTPSSQPSPVSIPRSKTLSGGYQVFQTFNNCGPAALSMALSHYDQQVSQQLLGQQLRPYQNAAGNNDDKSVTLAELAALAPPYQLAAYHRPAGTTTILEQFIANDMPVLTRTWLRPNEDIGHYRLVKGYDQDARIFIQDDSLQGANLRYTYSEFNDLWKAFNYEFLVLVPPDKTKLAEQLLGDLNNDHQAWTIALSLADQQLAQNPTDLYAGFNRSVALYELGRYDESAQAFEHIEGRLPSRMLWYQIEPILAYARLENHQRLLSLTDQILNNQNRAFSELHYLRARSYQAIGNTAAAQTALAETERYNTSGSWRANVESF